MKSVEKSIRERIGFEAAVIAAACALRFYALALKPTHFDEGINGYFVDQIWRNGFFRYDPSNFHGPLYFYLLHLSELTFGWGIWSFRAITAVASLACVIQALAYRRFIGRAASLWAAAALAVSPAFVFYGRYAIHESTFVLGQIWFVYGFLGWRAEGGRRPLSWMAAGFAVMASCKETFAVFMLVGAIAWQLVKMAERHPRFTCGESALASGRLMLTQQNLWNRIALSIAAIACFFSGFGMNRNGLLDFFTAFAFWTKTGVAHTGHEKPWHYWFELMRAYEPALTLGFVTVIASLFYAIWIAFRSREHKVTGPAHVGSSITNRILALLGLGLLAAYSLIPYKTPWCLLSAAWPFAFTFGSAVAHLSAHARLKKTSYASVAIAFAAVMGSVFLAARLNFFHYADPAEPYVYVQSTDDLTRLTRKIDSLVSARPELRAISILIMLRDPWPLPWVFSRFPNLRYGKLDGVTPIEHADVVIFDGTDQETAVASLRLPPTRRYRASHFRLREGYDTGAVFLAEDIFGDRP